MSVAVLTQISTDRSGLRWTQKPDPLMPLRLYWLAFVGAVACFVLAHVSDIWPSWMSLALEIGSCVTCGLAWLLSRALFRPMAQIGRWPLVVVGLQFACTLPVILTDTGTGGLARVYVANLAGLLGSAMLVLTALEGLNAQTKSTEERRFRAIFITVYLLILAIALAARLPELSDLKTGIQLSMAIIGALAATAAVQFRLQEFKRTPRQKVKTLNPTLARRIVRLLETQTLYRQPGLKVSDLARHLNEPEYRVSQAIVQTLGQRNFNQWINHYRITEAKERLSEPGAEALSILNLSLDCGFNSLGPFNRAFKAETGMTPSEFRRKKSG